MLKGLSSFSAIPLILLRSINPVEANTNTIPSNNAVAVLDGLCGGFSD